MVRISKDQSIKGHGRHTEEFAPHSIAAISGVLSQETTWFDLQKNHHGSSWTCDGWRGKTEVERPNRGLLQKT